VARGRSAGGAGVSGGSAGGVTALAAFAADPDALGSSPAEQPHKTTPTVSQYSANGFRSTGYSFGVS
jgi:hypothetical protein